MEHRQWLATATLPALLSLAYPIVGFVVLANCALLNLLAATAIDHTTVDGVPRLSGASLLMPLLGLAQLIGAAALLAADVLELAPIAIESRWTSRRLRALSRDREHSLPPPRAAARLDSLAVGVPPSTLAGIGSPLEALDPSWRTHSRRGGAAGLPPWWAWWLRCLRRSWPVAWTARALDSTQRLMHALADGRVRAQPDGFPEDSLLAVGCRNLLSLGFCALEPQLLFGALVVLCSLPVLVASSAAPVALACQLILLVASRSDAARSGCIALTVANAPLGARARARAALPPCRPCLLLLWRDARRLAVRAAAGRGGRGGCRRGRLRTRRLRCRVARGPPGLLPFSRSGATAERRSVRWEGSPSQPRAT